MSKAAVKLSDAPEIVQGHALRIIEQGDKAARFSDIYRHLIADALDEKSFTAVVDHAAGLIEEALPGTACIIEIAACGSSAALRSDRLQSGPLEATFGLDAETKSLLSHVFTTGKSEKVLSFLRDAAWVEHGLRAVAAGYSSGVAVALPAREDGRPLGAIALYFRREDGPDDAAVDKLESLASLLAQVPAVQAKLVQDKPTEERFAELASTIPGVVYQRRVQPNGEIRYTYISGGAKELFGVDAETIVRDPQALFNHYGADYRATFRQKLILASQAMTTWDVEAQIIRPDGSIRYTHAIAHPRREEDGSVLWTGVILDATRMKLAEMEAAEAETRTREAIVESFSQGLLLFGPDSKLIVRNSKFFSINPQIEDIAVAGAHYVDVVRAELDPLRVGQITQSDPAPEMRGRLAAHAASTGSVFERQISEDRWILVNDNPTDDGGRVVLYTDVTDLKRRERDIEHIAHHDALTGLPNRVLFRRKLDEAVRQATLTDSHVAVVFIDLDRFKAVNDTLGHPIGDALLELIGDRILECIRSTDVAARLGGDEFAIIVSQNATTETLTSLAWRLIDSLGQPALIEGHQVVVGASIGIALDKAGTEEVDDLIKNADLAVYRAKSDGRGTFRFFEIEMDAIAQQRRQLETDLRLAVRTCKLDVHYQPQVDVFTGQMVGAEALIRWNHKTLGWVPPLDFIPLAEETGLIVEIGEFVLRKACRDAMTWPLATRVSVNCSPAQFKNGGFVAQVATIIEETGLQPDRLEIEVTESLLIRDTDANLKTLWGLKDLGIRVAMDDFGTGYSSLGNLRAFPFDKIKIDRSFIKDLKTSVDAAAIIRAVVSLGRSLGITTTAEGVETRDQLAYLRGEGCSEVQGFFYSEAQPSDLIHKMLLGSHMGVISPR